MEDKQQTKLIEPTYYFDISHGDMLLMLNSKVYRSKSCKDIRKEHIKQIEAGEPLESTLRVVALNYFKYMMKNPVDMQIAQLNEMYPWTDCIIQAKADGQRCLLVVYQKTIYLVFESCMKPIGTSSFPGLSVFECELMRDSDQSQYVLVYDQQMWQDEPICTQKYYYRVRDLGEQLALLVSKSAIMDPSVRSVTAKEFVQIRKNFTDKQIYSALSSVQNAKFCTDGLIFNTNSPLQYQSIYKWKPIERLTIDFLCIRTNPNTYELRAFNPETNDSVAFSSPILDCCCEFESQEDLHEKIGEFAYHVKENKWRLIKVRTDKSAGSKGNGLKTARNILSNILYNISFDMLCKGLSGCYFEFKRSRWYSPMTQFINIIKQEQIMNIYDYLTSINITNPVILDLGAGKGQDVMKFQDFAYAYCVDFDKYALWELNQRTSALKTNLKVKTIQTDLANWNSINLLPQSVDLLNCNLALHYFIDTLPYIVQRTQPKVINLLVLDASKLNEQDTYYEHGQLKYQYYTKEDDNSQIFIKLPFKDRFSQETRLYPQQIIQMLESHKYSLKLYQSLLEYDKAFNHLSEADRRHIANYSVLQFNL